MPEPPIPEPSTSDPSRPNPSTPDPLPPKRMGILCLTLLTLLFAQNLVGLATAPILANPAAAPAGDRVIELQQRIDPNLAPWWELAQLPGFGPVVAKRIIAHRQAAGPLAFRRLADLDPIKRIGPITLQKIAPYLSFPAPTKKP